MSFDRAAFADKIRRSMEHLDVGGNEVVANTGIADARLSILRSGGADPTGDEVLILADYSTVITSSSYPMSGSPPSRRPTVYTESTAISSANQIGELFSNSYISANVNHGSGEAALIGQIHLALYRRVPISRGRGTLLPASYGFISGTKMTKFPPICSGICGARNPCV
jgi:hypothetical protein